MENKHCRECGKPVFGRIDKKYCSDICRHSHNNRERIASGTYVNTINAILRKNRNILSDLNPETHSKVSKNKLDAKGFNFNYITSVDTNTKEVCYYCYEYGYKVAEADCIYIIKKED